MARFNLDSMYRELARSPIGTRFQGPGSREWVKTPFGLRPVGVKETAQEVLSRSTSFQGPGNDKYFRFPPDNY